MFAIGSTMSYDDVTAAEKLCEMDQLQFWLPGGAASHESELCQTMTTKGDDSKLVKCEAHFDGHAWCTGEERHPFDSMRIPRHATMEGLSKCRDFVVDHAKVLVSTTQFPFLVGTHNGEHFSISADHFFSTLLSWYSKNGTLPFGKCRVEVSEGQQQLSAELRHQVNQHMHDMLKTVQTGVDQVHFRNKLRNEQVEALRTWMARIKLNSLTAELSYAPSEYTIASMYTVIANKMTPGRVYVDPITGNPLATIVDAPADMTPAMRSLVALIDMGLIKKGKNRKAVDPKVWSEKLKKVCESTMGDLVRELEKSKSDATKKSKTTKKQRQRSAADEPDRKKKRQERPIVDQNDDEKVEEGSEDEDDDGSDFSDDENDGGEDSDQEEDKESDEEGGEAESLLVDTRRPAAPAMSKAQTSQITLRKGVVNGAERRKWTDATNSAAQKDATVISPKDALAATPPH